jgi:PHD/YefM family antitoxin component YafN of YafNO toxin-antitoxin module
MKTVGRKPEIVLRNGRPAAVILDIGEYQELLERAEDVADLKRLQVMRKKPLRFTKLKDYLNGRRRRV